MNDNLSALSIKDREGNWIRLPGLYVDDPTQEEINYAIDHWLDAHPEATTTVLDGSLTEAKFTDSLQLKTIKDYVTPEMFGAKGDGVTDDSAAFQAAYDAVKSTGGRIYLPSSSYYLGSGITGINHTGRKRVSFIGIAYPTVYVASNITVFSVGDDSWITDLEGGYGYFELQRIFFQCEDKTSILIDNKAMRTIVVDGCRVLRFNIGVRTTGSWSGSRFNSTFHVCNKGVELLDRCNYTQFFRASFLACGIGVHFNNPTYEITTASILQCDFEGNTVCVQVDSAGAFSNLSIENCNFETSTNAIIVSNAVGTSNKNAIRVEGNNFYFSGYIKFGTDSSGSYVSGVIFANNFVSSDTDDIVHLGSDCPAKIFGLQSFSNVTAGHATNFFVYPSGVGVTSMSGEAMVRYPETPTDPWGSGDTGGVQGDIRYSGNYFFIRTNTGWKRGVLNSNWARSDGETYLSVKTQTVTYTPDEDIASGATVNISKAITIPSGFSVASVTLMCGSSDVVDFKLRGINEENQYISITITNNHSAGLRPSIQARMIYLPSA